MNNRSEARIMLENGISAEDVANELGIARSAVYHLVDTLLTEKRAERNKLIIAAYKGNWPVKIMSDKFELSKTALYRILRANSVELRRTVRQRIENCDETIVMMYERGSTLKAIREYVHATPGYIYAVLDREGIPRRRPRGNIIYTIEALNKDTPDNEPMNPG